MTNKLLLLLLMAVLFGCSTDATDPEQDPQPAATSEEQQAPSSAETTTEFTHRITIDTEFYTGGPQQARPPDGTMKAGTKVILIREAGSYCQVQSEDGVEAYVTTGSLEPIAPKPTEQ